MKRFLLFLLALCALTNVAQAQVGVVRSSGVYAVQKAKPQELGPLTRNGNVYYYHGEPMTRAQMVQFLNENCKQAYDYYKKQQRIEYAGWGIFSGGIVVCLGVGLPVLAPTRALEEKGQITRKEAELRIGTGLGLICFGAVSSVCIGVPMIIAGNVQKKNAHKQYNTWCGYKELEQAQASPLELKLTSGANGLGLALSF